jgi:hypothetical protein
MEDPHEERMGQALPGAAVHVAVREGSVRILRWLYAHCADLSQRTTDTQATPMYSTMGGGNYSAVVFLYKHGCHRDLAAIASNGKVPLDCATEFGHLRRWREAPICPPGQVIQEAALCPVARAEVGETDFDTDAEKTELERIELKALAMQTTASTPKTSRALCKALWRRSSPTRRQA